MPCSAPRTMRKSMSTRGTSRKSLCQGTALSSPGQRLSCSFLAVEWRPSQSEGATAVAHVKIALVHDWLITWRGGEKVLEALLELMPDADLYTLFHEPLAMPESIERRAVHTAFVDGLPYARRVHRQLLPLLPWAVST